MTDLQREALNWLKTCRCATCTDHRDDVEDYIMSRASAYESPDGYGATSLIIDAHIFADIMAVGPL